MKFWSFVGSKAISFGFNKGSKLLSSVLIASLCVLIICVFFSGGYDGNPLPSFNQIWSEVTTRAGVLSHHGEETYDLIAELSQELHELDFRLNRDKWEVPVINLTDTLIDPDGNFYDDNLFTRVYFDLNNVLITLGNGFYQVDRMIYIGVLLIRILLSVLLSVVSTLDKIFSLPFAFF